MRQTVVALVLVVWCAPVLGPLGPSSSPAQESAGPHVVHFSPDGTIKKIRQVTARFSEPMVPLGDPRPASDVFEIACPEAGTARWVDRSEEHTSELQSHSDLVCRLLLEKKKNIRKGTRRLPTRHTARRLSRRA